MTLDELVELERKATARPWKWIQPVGMGANCCIYSGAEPRVAGAYAGWSPIAEHVTGFANCDAIVALRNLAPELLVVAKYAMELRRRIYELDGCTLKHTTPESIECWDRLDAALRALREKEQQQ